MTTALQHALRLVFFSLVRDWPSARARTFEQQSNWKNAFSNSLSMQQQSQRTISRISPDKKINSKTTTIKKTFFFLYICYVNDCTRVWSSKLNNSHKWFNNKTCISIWKWYTFKIQGLEEKGHKYAAACEHVPLYSRCVFVYIEAIQNVWHVYVCSVQWKKCTDGVTTFILHCIASMRLTIFDSLGLT